MCIRDRRSIYLEPVELGQAKVEVDAVWGLTNRQAHTLFSVPSDHDVIAVSYTHLDVYKRQA